MTIHPVFVQQLVDDRHQELRALVRPGEVLRSTRRTRPSLRGAPT
jgi:hypothetical protein